MAGKNNNGKVEKLQDLMFFLVYVRARAGPATLPKH